MLAALFAARAVTTIVRSEDVRAELAGPRRQKLEAAA
jgi:hypothetical protein